MLTESHTYSSATRSSKPLATRTIALTNVQAHSASNEVIPLAYAPGEVSENSYSYL